MRRIAFFSALALLVAGCQGAENALTDTQDPSFFIADGQTGGNPDFFWLPPMVGNPSSVGMPPLGGASVPSGSPLAPGIPLA